MALRGSFAAMKTYWSKNTLLANVRTSKTISFWAKVDPCLAGFGWYIASWVETLYPYMDGTNHLARITLENTTATTPGNTRLRMWKYTQAGAGVSSTAADTTFAWHHYAFVFNGTQVTVYIDGVSAIAATAVPDVETGVFILGLCYNVPTDADSMSPLPWSNLSMCDLAVWNGQLTAGECLTLYASGTPTYSRTATTVAGVSKTTVLRCPLECNLVDVVSALPVLTGNGFPDFIDDSDLWPAWDDSEIIVTQNPGVASNHILGQTPGQLIVLSDSFGSMNPIRMLGPLYNRLAFGKFGAVASNSQSVCLSNTTGATGTIYNWTASGGSPTTHRIENSTTRTITGNSYASTTKTVTYDGPNLLVGQSIRINSVYYTVATFTPGSGTGAAQTGAQVTFVVTPDPGSLIGQNIHALAIMLNSVATEVFNNGTSVPFINMTAQKVADYSGVPEVFNTGSLDRLGERSDQLATIRIYHRIASDVAQQVKSVLVKRANRNGVYETVATLTGLDNVANAGNYQMIEITDVPLAQYTGSTNYAAQIVSTATLSDTQNRYFQFIMAEIEIDDTVLRMVDSSESSASPTGLIGTPGLKSMGQFDINRFVETMVFSDRQAVIAINMDMEDRSDWATLYGQIKTAWDTAFTAAGYDAPKYLIWSNYMHNTGGTNTLATWRHAFHKQSVGGMDFAIANDDSVEFIPLYKELGWWELPRSEVTGVPGPGAMPKQAAAGGHRIDHRSIPFRYVYNTVGSWNQATLTLTSVGNFSQIALVLGGYSYVYVARTSIAGTAVVDGWYIVTGATADTLTLASSITGGSAGVGTDVQIFAVATNSLGLHASGYLPGVIADALTNLIATSLTRYIQTTPGGDAIFHIDSGLTPVYCYPEDPLVPLSDWLIHRKLATESASPDEGRYSFSPDPAYETYRIFVGASQPADWDEALPEVLFLGESGVSLTEIEASTVLAKEATVAARPTLSQIEASSSVSGLVARLGAFTGTGVNTVLGFLKAMMSKTATTPSDVGGTYAVTTDSLEAQEEVVSGLGHVPALIVSPGILRQISRNTNNVIDLYVNETGLFTTLLFDDKNKAVNLAGGPWTIYVANDDESFTFDAALTVSGADNNQVTFDLDTLCDTIRLDLVWSIRLTTGGTLKATGKMNIRYAP